jgi:hypothetical protein
MTMEFSQKPDLSLYIGRYVADIIRGGQPWQWGLRLDDQTEIRNKDRRETYVPEHIVGKRITTITISEHDTTIHFSGDLKWSLNPTQYSIYDPKHGGEVYPQWPEELEEAGIPSHPEEQVSEPPKNVEEWNDHRAALLREHDSRIAGQAREFLAAEEEEKGEHD